MFHAFEADTADETWRAIANEFRIGRVAGQASRAGSTRELLHAAISISRPRERWIVSRNPPINPAFAMAEIIWIVTGRNDSWFLTYFNRKLPEFAGDGPILHGAYGYRLRRHLELDQLSRAYHTLASNPDSRQVVLQIWDGTLDLPHPDGHPRAQDIPCNVLSMLKVRENKLHWTQIIRSNDFFLGLPYNLIQFTTLQEIIAGWLEVEVGPYYQISDSLHIYDRDYSHLEDVVVVNMPKDSDSLALSKQKSELTFAELARNVDIIIDESASTSDLETMQRDSQLPTAFRNMLCVLCAEGARRRSGVEKSREMMRSCTNPVFALLFDRWLEEINGIRKAKTREQNV